MKTRESFSQTFGLHPLVGFSLFSIDTMLFASEVATFEATWALTIPIGLALAVFATVLQKMTYGDSWRAALGKGAIVGVLTAIPLPLASLTALVGGVIGAGKTLLEGKQQGQLAANK